MIAAVTLAGCSLVEARTKLAAVFAAAGLDSPVADARRLLAHALSVTTLDLIVDPSRRLSPAEAEVLAAFAARRVAHEPVSRIVGQRWFYGRPFRITPATLDPRPESETIIDAALELLGPDARNRAFRVLDIGTGSGCLLLTLLAEFGAATGVGTDISAEALEVARANALRLDMGPRATFHLGADFGPLDATYDLIVCNPPYIPTDEIDRLDRDVHGFDPRIALDGGRDGLAAYRRLASEFYRYISNGWIIFEVGSGQAEAVSRLLRAASGAEPRLFADLAGVQRCVAASPRPAATPS